jgi:hypothetical protein
VRTAAVLCVLALIAAGCGAGETDSSKSFDGQERAVARAVEDLEKAGRDGKEREICSQLLSERLLAAVRKQGTNCVTAVKEALEDTDSFDLEVEDVTINGERASAKVKSGRAGGSEKTDTLGLQREGAEWKIASLGGGGST